MSLKERLAQDLKDAMREKDAVRKDTVQLTRAAILQIEKDNKITLDDEGVIDVIAKEVKKRRDVLPDYEKSGRADLMQTINRELEILLAYLPQQLTESEIDEIVKQSIIEVGASSMKDIGNIMKNVMPKVKGKADGRMINESVKRILN